MDIPSRKEAAAISEQVRLLLEDEQPMPAAMMMFTWLQNHAEVGDTRAVAGSRGVCVLAAAGLIFLHFHPRMTNTTHTMPASVSGAPSGSPRMPREEACPHPSNTQRKQGVRGLDHH